MHRLGIIILREFRQKARGLATVGILTFFLGVTGLVCYMTLITGYISIEGGFTDAARVGRSLANAMLITQLVLTAIFGLSFNGSAITQERDRETIDLLNLTLLTNSEIVLGKMLASVLFIVLLLFAGLPFFALSYTFGGWEMAELASAVLVIFSLVMLVSTIGLAISVNSKDTRTALGRTFSILIVAVVATLYFGIRYTSNFGTGGQLDYFHIVMGLLSLYVNPFYSLMSILEPQFLNSGGGTPVQPSVYAYSSLPFWANAFIIQIAVSLAALGIAIRNYGGIRKGER